MKIILKALGLLFFCKNLKKYIVREYLFFLTNTFMDYFNFLNFIAWSFIWSIISLFVKEFLERWKLKKEREFSFKKEELFKLNEKFFELQKIILEIDKLILYDNDLSYKKFYDKLTNFESFLNTYFIDFYDDYVKYNYLIIEFINNNLLRIESLKIRIWDVRNELIWKIRIYIKNKENELLK